MEVDPMWHRRATTQAAEREGNVEMVRRPYKIQMSSTEMNVALSYQDVNGVILAAPCFCFVVPRWCREDQTAGGNRPWPHQRPPQHADHHSQHRPETVCKCFQCILQLYFMECLHLKLQTPVYFQEIDVLVSFCPAHTCVYYTRSIPCLL